MSDMDSVAGASRYDSNVHDNQIVAIYQDRPQAHAARDALVRAGVPMSAIEVIDGETDAATRAGTTDQVREEGFWGAMKNLFAPDEDVHAYSHAVSQGHSMLVVTPNASMDRERVIDTLESTSPLDLDAKVEEWRKQGYAYTPQPRNAAMTGATNIAASAKPAPASTATSATATSATRADLRPGDETLKVMEERLRVGKREVAGGAVRVRSYVVERPVEEQVQLHEERVSIDRRPVDRPATPEEMGLFQEHTIEARATSEEAVISKEARVVEEIGIRKEATDRTETVRDTVRKTEVEVDDQSKSGTPAGSMGTGGVVTNATPGATSSGTNSPRPTK